MDYKQFEGHTAEPWQVRTEKEFIKPKTFEIINHEGLVIASVNIGMFDVEQNSRLLASAPDLLKENQELKLELQKQKELNAELVKFIKEAEAWLSFNLHPSSEEISKFKSSLKSLIKKSNEI